LPSSKCCDLRLVFKRARQIDRQAERQIFFADGQKCLDSADGFVAPVTGGDRRGLT
jgi:hypothetical protein